ncbi:TPA: hypothetical protein RI355_002545 [Escherichia coli]|uniref:hypothetical protein n=1 Tax=Citrobacter portucalensis TaxID=1639133 RepID=UPI00285389C0|nr:hypothetical protein [Citrobacter portucalensis]MEB2740426.1 hypothetical protein [Citrobacter portucalensis]HDV5085829.1 hypothetical protein [Escherichia coli]
MVFGNRHQPDTEPEEPVSVGIPTAVPKGNSGRKSFSNLRRELTDEELSSAAVQRMLLDEIERLDGECNDLRVIRDKFHTSDKLVGVLEEKFKTKIALEIMHVTCFLISGSAFGYATSNWSTQPTAAVLALAFGSALTVGGIAAKVVKP